MSNNLHNDEETHFGFQTVNASKKASMVRNVFDNVAQKYDIMNDVMSGGLHRVWKNDLINTLKPKAGMALLDVAGGTGDVAFRFLNKAYQKSGNKENPAHVTVCDINHSMLSVGADRAIDHGHLQNIDWVCGDAEKLPFPDQSFDAYTIAFGIRNVTHIDQALTEAYRVLKPGGRLLCLEFSHVNLPVLDKIYDFYSFNLIPKFGELITQDKESYQYLVESIRRFPTQDAFKSMIEEAGFKRVTYRNMTGGVVALHSAWRI